MPEASTGPAPNQDPTQNPEASAQGTVNGLRLAARGVGNFLRGAREWGDGKVLETKLAVTDEQLDRLEGGPSKIAEAMHGERRDPNKPPTPAQTRKLARGARNRYNLGQVYEGVEYTPHSGLKSAERDGGKLEYTGGDSFQIPPSFTEEDKRRAAAIEKAEMYGMPTDHLPKPTKVKEYQDAHDQVHETGALLPKGILYSPERTARKSHKQAERINEAQGLGVRINNVAMGLPGTSQEAIETQQQLLGKRGELRKLLGKDHGIKTTNRSKSPTDASFANLPSGEPKPPGKEQTQDPLLNLGQSAANLELIRKRRAAVEKQEFKNNQPTRIGDEITAKINSLRNEQRTHYGAYDDITVFEQLAEHLLERDHASLSPLEKAEVEDLATWYKEHVSLLEQSGRASAGKNGNRQRLDRLDDPGVEPKIVPPDAATIAELKKEISDRQAKVVASYGFMPRRFQVLIENAVAKQTREEHLLTNASSHERADPKSTKPFKYHPRELEADQRKLAELLK